MKKAELLTLTEAAKLFPTPPGPQTLWRWRTRGVNGVTLACVKCGQRWYTTLAAIEIFLAAQTAAANSKQRRIDLPVERDAKTTQQLRDAGLI